MVKPMQAELTTAGFQDLHSAEAVENNETRRNNACSCKFGLWLLLETHAQEQNEFRRC
jgi:hypothetical protein